MFRPTQAIVDLEALRGNFRALKNLAGSGFFCPMVKSNAYGHGDVVVVETLAEAGAERVGVALMEEGIHLRENGVRIEILVFGKLTEASAKAAVEFGLTPVVSTWDDLEIFKRLPVAPTFHIKLNTGMNRMGFSLGEVPKLRDFFKQEKSLRCLGVATHLSHGHDANEPGGHSEKQIQLFKKAFEEIGMPQAFPHVLNSEGLLFRKKDVAWLGARPGLALYGLVDSPSLRPVMTLQTKVDLVRKVAKGESISYGGRWTASKDSWVAVVPIGYGDGYFRALSNKGQMLFREQRVPVVGTVCMDYSLLDLTAASHDGAPRLGEDVVVFGSQGNSSMSVMDLAKLIDSIPYEFVANLSPRVPRVYR
jgi:alanine racemase